MSAGRLRAKLFGFLTVVVVLVIATLASGNAPLLGLDLQGGISVVLEPLGRPKPGSVDVAVDIIRNRVDGLGVSEPEISKQGGNIVIDLPGVANRDKARRLVGQTAELRFRPVLAILPPETLDPLTTTTTTVPKSGTTVAGGGSTTTTEPTTTTTAVAADAAAQKAAVASCDPNAVLALKKVATTSRTDDTRDACVVLPLRAKNGAPLKQSTRLLLGPTQLTGSDVASAKSEFVSPNYGVSMTLTSGGLGKFNTLAAKSYGRNAPNNEVAIALDGVVQSNPAFQAASFSGPVQITGNFSSTEASDLAKLINYGALPVQLKELTAENVSPTLGKDQLDAGIIAGIIGLVLVSLYMLAYYRVLGLVAILGIGISAALLLVVVTSFVGQLILEFLGGSGRPVLTLAGVTGLIVSIGVTVDSYVVYFERLKDEVRAGRSVRTSADRGFTRSFRTIVAADLVSFLGAAVLFLIAVGSVKGFAFFLGLSTLLDLLVAYFFMHPLVSLMSRNRGIVTNRVFGIGAGLDAPDVEA
ncbi:MAG: protein translocase subunit SecD [Actinomycetes bacterium]